jgi:formimidoylglutamate deiminase
VATELHFHAARAWVGGRWAQEVLLSAVDGIWRDVAVGVAAPEYATRLPGPVLPAIVNAHSHAFQRAIAGLTERRAAGARGADDFWSWRERMYACANRITPAQVEAVAAFLYAELLAGGYTHVCEFHYLQHDQGGRPYADALEMSLALVRAAGRVGIGITLLPVLYARSGFGAATLRDDQRRFASTPHSVAQLAEGVARQCGGAQVNVGAAIHSLRAADPGAVRELAATARQKGWPLHVHIAEQTGEVEDCIAHTGARPIEWLLSQLTPDRHWNLVHATHATAQELAGVRASGAAIVLCPTTEADLGDGVFDLPGYAGGAWSVGSDSHVARAWPPELQMLEYAQRLTLRRRNVAVGSTAGHGAAGASCAAALFESALAGGAQAAGRALGALAPGNRADFLELDGDAPALLGIPPDDLLDALVFSVPTAPFARVHAAARCVAGTAEGACAFARQPQLAEEFARAMRQLWEHR